MNRATDEKRSGAIWGTFIGDILRKQAPLRWRCATRAFGVSPFLLLAIGALACWLLVRYRGQRVEESAPE